MNEFTLIQKIKKLIPRKLQCEIGIGDDAAVMSPPQKGKLVWTTDTLIEGVDFLFDFKHTKAPRHGCLDAREVGRKALAVNLSDLAAVSARPLACLVALGIPHGFPEQRILDFYRGLIKLAETFQVKVVGGDMTSSRDFFAAVSLLGISSKVMTRSGARAGDWIGVSGSLGGSILKKHAAFTPRIPEGLFLGRYANALIDISDGLLQDLDHILRQSRVGADLELTEIPISEAAVTLSKKDPLKSLERACSDGEDFELLFTVSEKQKTKISKEWKRNFPKVPLSWLGRVTSKSGVVAWRFQGRAVKLPPFKQRGFQHF